MTTMSEVYRPGDFHTEPIMDLLENDSRENEDLEVKKVAKEDVAVWCEKCGVHNIGDCIIHGGKMTVAPDNAMPTRACLSLPKILTLKRVRDVEPCSLEAKRGVFSKKFIKLRTRFGPMEAKKTPLKPKLQTGMMEYQLQTSDGTQEYLDVSDENDCNWMMFVRPANVFSQQNMAAFQDKGDIYFVTCKNIPKGAELRVWYTAAYAKAIGKRILLPERIDKQQALTVKKEKKSCLEKGSASGINHAETENTLAEKSDVKNTSPENKTKIFSPNLSPDLHLMDALEKSSRAVRAPKDNSASFTCNTCNTLFSKVGQLDSHVCKELGEEDDSLGCGTRRRKGKPRKFLENEGDQSAGKVPKAEVLEQAACRETNGANIPHDDIISYLNGDVLSSNGCGKLDGDVVSPVTLLPSIALIPTTADFFGDEGENKHRQTRKPGRPRGSKNKNKVVIKQSSESKTDTSPSKRQMYVCQFCEKSFTSQEQHLVHEASHTNTHPYTCDYPGCGKSFNSKFKYNRHITVHKKPNNFKCKFCSSAFNRVDHLKNHLLVHDSNRNTFTCTICGKSYLYKSNLTFHMAKHEADEGESLRCLVCDTRFDSKEQLKLHVNIHNRYKKDVERQRKHSCPQCSRMFTTAKDIRRHMVTHSKERHFLCEHCPQTFVRKDHLRRHYTSNHKKEFYESQLKNSPYGCGACKLVFTQKKFLDYHLKTVHPHGMDTEAIFAKDKAGRCSVKSESLVENIERNAQETISRVSKDSQNQLVKLLQKQPKQRTDPPAQQLMQITQKSEQSAPSLQQGIPLNVVKIQQVSSQSSPPRPYAIVYPAPMQSSTSQTPVFTSEEVIGEPFATSVKSIPLRVQNHLFSRQHMSGQIATHLQLPQETQQDPQHQLQQDRQMLLSQIQIQQQQVQVQQQQQQQVQVQQQQVQVQQPQYQQHQQLHHQVQSQSVTPVVQGMSIDLFNSLTGFTPSHELPGYSNTGLINIITVDGHKLLLDLNKHLQVALIKEPQADSKHQIQQHPLTQQQLFGIGPKVENQQTAGPITTQQHSGVKLDTSSFVQPQGQIFTASISKPDHCYATASVTDTTFPQAQMAVIDKSNVLQSHSVINEETTRILNKHTASGSTVLVSSLPENTPNQNKLLVTQQHQQQTLQNQQMLTLHQDHFQQQENQQQDQQQQQSLQNLPSFTLAWPDGLSDYTPVAELPLSGDITSISQTDGHGMVVHGATPSSWILQLPVSMFDQTHLQQLQGQHMASSHIVTVTAPGPVSEG